VTTSLQVIGHEPGWTFDRPRLVRIRAVSSVSDDSRPSSPIAEWPDARLLAAIRAEPPDVSALDALVARYWKSLYARCTLLTANRETASDLAQETWCRVLRARRGLDPHGNFPAYIARIATNIWRDWSRSSRRAGPLADHRLASLDAELGLGDGDTVLLRDALSDLDALPPEEQVALRLDVDRVLARLSPRAREVLVSRYIDGDSAAEIGTRLGRTEQTITSWIREAIREIRQQLGPSSAAPTREVAP
jgi:RNA polymerase sigma factor (sigma-70 family)